MHIKVCEEKKLKDGNTLSWIKTALLIMINYGLQTKLTSHIILHFF